MSEISETSVWLKFFTEAGIQPSDATLYAITFIDNRIKQDMLPDLNKEYLKDMGITALGDIIAILKHARTVTNTLSKERVFPSSSTKSTKTSSNASPSSLQNSQPDTIPSQSSSTKKNAATRILEHYVRKEPPPPPPSAANTSNLSSRLGGGTKRQLEDDELPVKARKTSSVFDRLGGENDVSSTTSDSPKITVTMVGRNKFKDRDPSPDMFASRSRLKKKMQSAVPTSVGPSLSQLQYHGVLKYSQKELEEKHRKEKIRLANSPHLSVTVKSTAADSTAIKSRLGRNTRPTSQSEGIFAREFHQVAKTKGSLKNDGKEFKKSLIVPAPAEDKRIIKKIVKMKKKTGQIVSERRVSSGIFSRIV